MKRLLAILWIVSLSHSLHAQRTVKPVDTLAALAAANVTDVNTNAFVVSVGGIYTYNPSSGAATNALEVIKPNTGAGRWILEPLLGNGATITGTLTAENLAVTNSTTVSNLTVTGTLTATNATITSSGSPFYYQTNMAFWGDSIVAAGTGSSLAMAIPIVSGYLLGTSNYLGGVGGETSTQIKDRVVADTTHTNWPTVFEGGVNDSSQTNTVVTNFGLMVAHLASGTPYLIFSVLNGSGEGIGTATYNYVTNINQRLAATYTTNFVDVRRFLIDHYDPAVAQDVLDYAADIVPSSLRADNIHPNAKGKLLAARILALYWKSKYQPTNAVLTETTIAGNALAVSNAWSFSARNLVASNIYSDQALTVQALERLTLQGYNEVYARAQLPGGSVVVGPILGFLNTDGTTASTQVYPTAAGINLTINANAVVPVGNNIEDFGTASLAWDDIYANILHLNTGTQNSLLFLNSGGTVATVGTNAGIVYQNGASGPNTQLVAQNRVIKAGAAGVPVQSQITDDATTVTVNAVGRIDLLPTSGVIVGTFNASGPSTRGQLRIFKTANGYTADDNGLEFWNGGNYGYRFAPNDFENRLELVARYGSTNWTPHVHWAQDTGRWLFLNGVTVSNTLLALSTIDAATGYTAASVAPSGYYMRGNGTVGVFAPLAANDLATGLVPTARLGTGVADSTTFLRGDGTWATPAASGGTVTSVGLSLPSFITVSGSPVTTSGTLTGTLATQTTNAFFVGPTTGAAAAPTFRGMVAADIPDALIVATSKLSATGTKDSTTFLRGDDTWAIPSGGSGTFFADPTASVGLSAVNGTSTNAMRSDAAPALSQAIVPTWTGTHTFRKTTTPVQIQYDSTHGLAIAVDSAGTPSFTSTTGTNAFVGIADASTGFTVASAATSAYYLRGDGTKGVFAQLSASDLATGTVPTVRLGSGVANSSTFLRGDNTWAVPSGGSGTFFADPTASVGLTAINGTSTNAMRADAAPAINQAINPTWTGSHIFRNTVVPLYVSYDVGNYASLAVSSIGDLTITPTGGDMTLQGRLSASTGFLVAGAAASGSYLRGNGTEGVFATLSASDLATGTVPTARLGSGAAGATTFLRGDQTWATAVTSVGLSLPAEFTVSGSPVTTSGTLSASKATQSANTVWAGPTSGSAAQPSFRALVTSDLFSPGAITRAYTYSSMDMTNAATHVIFTNNTSMSFIPTSFLFQTVSFTGPEATPPALRIETPSAGNAYFSTVSLNSGTNNFAQNFVLNATGGTATSHPVVAAGGTIRVVISTPSNSGNRLENVHIIGFYVP